MQLPCDSNGFGHTLELHLSIGWWLFSSRKMSSSTARNPHDHHRRRLGKYFFLNAIKLSVSGCFGFGIQTICLNNRHSHFLHWLLLARQRVSSTYFFIRTVRIARRSCAGDIKYLLPWPSCHGFCLLLLLFSIFGYFHPYSVHNS